MCQESRAFSAPERKLGLTKPKTAAALTPGVAGHQSSFNMSSAFSVRSQDTLPETVLKVSSRRRKFKKEKPPMNKKTRTRAWNWPVLWYKYSRLNSGENLSLQTEKWGGRDAGCGQEKNKKENCSNKVWHSHGHFRLVTIKAFLFKSTYWTVVGLDSLDHSWEQTINHTGLVSEYFVTGDTTRTTL